MLREGDRGDDAEVRVNLAGRVADPVRVVFTELQSGKRILRLRMYRIQIRSGYNFFLLKNMI
jgi:hypothetical protein